MSALSDLTPYLVLIVAGFLPNEVWRMLGIVVAHGLDESSELVIWLRAVATGLLAGVVAKIILFPPGGLADVRLPVRLLAIAIGAASLVLGRQFPPPAIRWDHVVWGYIKMGKVEEARTLAESISLEQPDNGPVWEAMGYLAAARQQYPDAVLHYQRAVALRPRSYLAHYNLAKALLALERRPEAVAEARIAESLNPSADARALLNQAEAAR